MWVFLLNSFPHLTRTGFQEQSWQCRAQGESSAGCQHKERSCVAVTAAGGEDTQGTWLSPQQSRSPRGSLGQKDSLHPHQQSCSGYFANETSPTLSGVQDAADPVLFSTRLSFCVVRPELPGDAQPPGTTGQGSAHLADCPDKSYSQFRHPAPPLWTTSLGSHAGASSTGAPSCPWLFAGISRVQMLPKAWGSALSKASKDTFCLPWEGLSWQLNTSSSRNKSHYHTSG